MGKVIAIRRPSEELAAALRTMALRAEKGDLDGGMFVLSRADGKQESAICGSFARNLGRATKAAQEGFNCLLGHKACIESKPEHYGLPLLLRKEVKNEETTCHAFYCSSRF